MGYCALLILAHHRSGNVDAVRLVINDYPNSAITRACLQRVICQAAKGCYALNKLLR